MARRVFEGMTIMHHSIYTEYRSSKKVKNANKVEGRENLRRLMKNILEIISNEITESTGGVNIKNLGYFFIWKIPRKMTYRSFVGDGEEKYNHHTNNHMYIPVFFPHKPKHGILRAWTFDKSFAVPIKERLSKNLRAGVRYNMYAHTLRMTK